MTGRLWVAVEDAATRNDLLAALSARGRIGVPIDFDRQFVDDAIAGVIVEIRPERAASRIELLHRLRTHRPSMPVLALIHSPTPDLLDALHARDIAACSSRPGDANLERFLSLTDDPALDIDSIRERVRVKAARKGLSRRETDLLLLATSGMPRKQIAAQLNVSENTVKAQIRSLLRKTGARNLAVLGQQLLRGDSVAPPAYVAD